MLNKFLNWIFGKKRVLKSGANIDYRPASEKEKDYKIEEFVTSFAPVNWRERPESEWRQFPIFHQDGSGSCVSQSMAKMMGILYWLKNNSYVHFSATDIYRRRSNKPESGMIGVDAFQIARDGVTLEVLVPSQNMTDQQMDSIDVEEYKIEVGKIFKIGNYIFLPTNDIEAVASVIQVTQKPVMVWFYFKYNEWDKEIPEIINQALNVNDDGVGRHSVTAVDFTLYNGKKALIIEDSWGPSSGKGGRRIITEDFFVKRNFFAAYTMNFRFDEKPEKPQYTFNNDLEFNQTNEEIKILQNVLKYENLFPVNVESTGYFGAVTKKAVGEFQLKYGVVDNVDSPGYGRVGPKTRAKLNELYS